MGANQVGSADTSGSRVPRIFDARIPSHLSSATARATIALQCCDGERESVVGDAMLSPAASGSDC